MEGKEEEKGKGGEGRREGGREKKGRREEIRQEGRGGAKEGIANTTSHR